MGAVSERHGLSVYHRTHGVIDFLQEASNVVAALIVLNIGSGAVGLPVIQSVTISLPLDSRRVLDEKR